MIMLNSVSIDLGRKTILNNIDLELDNNTYGLLGPNGAGKTTLFRCICGLYTSYKGQIHADWGGIKSCDIGYLPQNFNLFDLNVKDNMHYFAALKGIKNKKEEIDRTLEFVHLLDEQKKTGRQLSGGMKRRVGIAQALLGNPKIIILDEPTVGLDPEERENFIELIKRINVHNKTVLLSTHILNDVEECCDRILILRKGEIIFSGAAKELKNNQRKTDDINYTTSIQEDYLCFMKEI